MRARVSWLLTPSTIAAAVLLVRGRIRVLLVSATTWDVTGWWVVGVGEAGAGCGAQCVPYLGLELNGMVNHSGSFDAHDINHHR